MWLNVFAFKVNVSCFLRNSVTVKYLIGYELFGREFLAFLKISLLAHVRRQSTDGHFVGWFIVLQVRVFSWLDWCFLAWGSKRIQWRFLDLLQIYFVVIFVAPVWHYLASLVLTVDQLLTRLGPIDISAEDVFGVTWALVWLPTETRSIWWHGTLSLRYPVNLKARLTLSIMHVIQTNIVCPCSLRWIRTLR